MQKCRGLFLLVIIINKHIYVKKYAILHFVLYKTVYLRKEI